MPEAPIINNSGSCPHSRPSAGISGLDHLTMVDGMFSVIHGKNVWSLKSMFRRAMTLGSEERSVLLAVDDSDNAEYAFDCKSP
ncbi:hypothetical protein RRG08_049321 [Elysia crispata]|uniref:Uncharacterized protein n=1 Tax=Elysia crispata TaxID=231223 RepID=A0AAE0XEC3_9GAST|nr:hypothetical protein RRG08_049321 [Elysia crispata]